jgi:hypothetical protein
MRYEISLSVKVIKECSPAEPLNNYFKKKFCYNKIVGREGRADNFSD